jgi:hypothetical protein
MATGKDQTQSVVWHGSFFVFAGLLLGQPVQKLRLAGEGPLTSDPVDRAVARRGEEPGGRSLGHPACGPAVECRRDGVLKGILGEVEVAQDADQAREDASPLLAEDTLERGQCGITGRTSIAPPVRAAGILTAISIASSRLSHSTR